MFNFSTSDLLDFLFFALVVIGAIMSAIMIYLRKYRRPSHRNSSVLLSFYTQDSELFPGNKIKLPSGAVQISFVTEPQNYNIVGSYFVNIVYLPFTTSMRLLAIPKGEYKQLNPSLGKSLMEPVILEGDFQSSFSLFSNEGEGFKTRYVLDPAAMAFVVDFCRSYNWELINNELIIVSSKHPPVETLENFIKEIRPAVEISANAVDSDVKDEYKFSFGKQFPCPICRAQTIEEIGNWACPDGHGRLLRGGELAKLPKLLTANEVSLSHDANRNLKCPNCGQTMAQVPYAKNTIIDSCINCPFRWLDSGELE